MEWSRFGRGFRRLLADTIANNALEFLTFHGFRSAFRHWASERTNFAREICEAALAHIVENKTEAAYRRGDLFDRRRELMVTWAAFVAAGSADVISLRRSG